MIKFEFSSKPPHAITNDQLSAVYDLINEFGWGLDYDVVEHEGNPENPGVIHVWVHHGEGQNPTRHHISLGGIVFLHEDVDWDWKGTIEA